MAHQAPLMYYVKFANFQIVACNVLHQMGADVAGDDMYCRSDALREPL